MVCKGRLVGPLTSTQEITIEYAKADPIYINKTQVCLNVSSALRVTNVKEGDTFNPLPLQACLGRRELWLARYDSSRNMVIVMCKA